MVCAPHDCTHPHENAFHARIIFLPYLWVSKLHNVWHEEEKSFPPLSQTVSTEITEKNVRESREGRKRGSILCGRKSWRYIMVNPPPPTKKKQEKILAESAVRLKSICHHILLTNCHRCSLNAMLSATDIYSKANKSLHHHSLTVK